MKWKNWSYEDSTWEQERHLLQNYECKDLIKEFKKLNESRKSKKCQHPAVKILIIALLSTDAYKEALEDPSKRFLYGNDFQRQFAFGKVIGCRKINGELVSIVKWSDTNEEEQIPTVLLHKMYPQTLLDYYESILKLEDEEPDFKPSMKMKAEE